MPHSNHNRVRIDLGVYRHVVEEGGRRPRWSEGVDALWQGGKSRDAGSENTRLYRSHLGARRQAQSPSRPHCRPLLTVNSTYHTPAVLRRCPQAIPHCDRVGVSPPASDEPAESAISELSRARKSPWRSARARKPQNLTSDHDDHASLFVFTDGQVHSHQHILPIRTSE